MSYEVPAEVADYYRGRRIVVTGATGAIGAHLATGLAHLGASVVGVDDLSQSARWNLGCDPGIEFIRGDVGDVEVLDEAFAEPPDVVFHLAALFANQKSIDFPEIDLMTNGFGTLRILQRAASAPSRVVFTSTSCLVADEFGGSDEESAPFRVETPYQITKALGERYCNFFQEHHGVPTVRLRLFNSYGPGELPGRYRNVVPNFFEQALLGQPLTVLGDGSQTRDWTFVADIVDGLLRAGASTAAEGHAIHLASGRETTVLEMANLVNELTGNAAGIVFDSQRRWDQQMRRWTSTDKARTLLDFEARTDLRVGLGVTAEWFVANWSRIQGSKRLIL